MLIFLHVTNPINLTNLTDLTSDFKKNSTVGIADAVENIVENVDCNWLCNQMRIA